VIRNRDHLRDRDRSIRTDSYLLVRVFLFSLEYLNALIDEQSFDDIELDGEWRVFAVSGLALQDVLTIILIIMILFSVCFNLVFLAVILAIDDAPIHSDVDDRCNEAGSRPPPFWS